MSFNPSQPREPRGSSDGGQWVTVYHGTQVKNVAGIRRHGLRTGYSQLSPRERNQMLARGEDELLNETRSVYLTSSKQEVMDYATVSGTRSKGAVIELRVPKRLLGRDTRYALEHTLFSTKTIPAKYITDVKIFGPQKKGKKS